ncbi:MAG: polyamine aminopropyltransferase [Deltaproteobacteria bacterium]|nr:polyamine aminopropyltransferase [Deltaproteobacteria bacterium]
MSEASFVQVGGTTRYFDPWLRDTHLTYTVTHRHESFETPFQTIDVFEAEGWGTVLALGGVTNVTDRDESGYHEMLAHPALLAHPNPKRVLIIGGGDGGTLREVLRHPEVQRAVLVDIDGEVIRCARQYFPQCAVALDDPRAEVIVGDGLAYVEDAAAAGGQFDVILVDSTDPVDAAVELFTEKFYRHCAALLGDRGILVPQSDSPTFYLDRVAHVVATLRGIFAHTRLYLGQVTAYPGGVWAYTAASNGIDVGRAIDPAGPRVRALEPLLRYANGPFIAGAFALPTYIARRLAGAGPTALPTLADDPAGFAV